MLHDVLDINYSIYLNDILIYSNTEEEHVEHIKVVIDWL